MWWGGGPCDFSVSPSPFGLDFGTLDFGTSDSGLTIKLSMVAHNALSRMHRRQQSRPHINVVCDLTFKTAAITAAVTQ